MMGLRNYTYAIASVLLIAFLTVKVVSAHAFAHFSEDADTIETCMFCEHFMAQNDTPLALHKTPDVTVPMLFVFREVKDNYTYTYYNKALFYRFYNKPPPALL